MRLGNFVLSLLLVGNVYAYESYLYIADSDITSVPIKSNKEEMIDLTLQKDIAYGQPPLYAKNKEYTKIRKTVYEKLKQAQAKLPPGMKFCVYEGFRKIGAQEHLFRTHFQQVQATQPEASYETVFKETSRLIAPARKLDGTENIAPQFTGGAIAVYLIDEKGNPLEMGILPQDWYKDVGGALSRTTSTKVSKLAQRNRHIMSEALRAVGFVNYPALYWHWSYGDQYWAYHTHHGHAIYDAWQKG